jgi:hypothetical protein
VAQLPHVTGHAADTPSRAQRLFVSLKATHEQYLAIALPFLKLFHLKTVSAQPAGAGAEVVAIGALVGAEVVTVGVPIGAADGLGDGLMEEVGLFVGLSLGT